MLSNAELVFCGYAECEVLICFYFLRQEMLRGFLSRGQNIRGEKGPIFRS